VALCCIVLPSSQSGNTILLIAPVLGIAGLVALPFYAGEGEKSWHKAPDRNHHVDYRSGRMECVNPPWDFTPWSPKMNAWSGGPPIPVRYTHDLSPLQRQALSSFSRSNAATSHAIAGVGGQRGPALDLVATRLTEDQLIRQVPSGRRQHAGVWQEPKPIRDHRSRSVPGNPFIPSINQRPQMDPSGSHGRARSQPMKEASWRPLG